MKKRPNLVDSARAELQEEIAIAALRVNAVERHIAEYRELSTTAGYELLTAKADLREAISRLEAHNAQRTRGT